MQRDNGYDTDRVCREGKLAFAALLCLCARERRYLSNQRSALAQVCVRHNYVAIIFGFLEIIVSSRASGVWSAALEIF